MNKNKLMYRHDGAQVEEVTNTEFTQGLFIASQTVQGAVCIIIYILQLHL